MSYEIRVRGILKPSWSSSFEGMSVYTSDAGPADPITTLVGDLPDQSALRGILTKLWDLNLDLISVTRVEAREEAT